MCLYGEFLCIVYKPNPTAKVAQDILAYGQYKLQVAGQVQNTDWVQNSRLSTKLRLRIKDIMYRFS